jgi:tetratricopeptide (TPR) repeat protein
LADEVAQEATDEAGTPDPRSPEEGWGFSDWYEGTQAKREASEIRSRIRFARELLAIDPDSDWALQTLAYYQYLAQDYTSTLETYERFIDLYPDDPSGYNNIGLVYKRIEDYSTEEAYYRRALALESLDVHALSNLAVNLSHQKRFDEALSIMEVLAVLDPDDPYADLHRAKIYAEMGKSRRAYAHLERALKGMVELDTLHHIEFRQDIRVDPSFRSIRKDGRFSRLLKRYYGDDGARGLVGDFRG